MLPGMGPCGPRASRHAATTTVAATALLGLCGAAATAPAASAQAGGAAAVAASPAAPAITSIACTSGCVAGSGTTASTVATVEQGGTVTLGGRGLNRARAVVFLGGRGSRDDARVTIRAKNASRVTVKLPSKARSGRVALVTTRGVAARNRAVSIRVVKPVAVPLATVAAPVLAPVAGIDGLEAGIAARTAGKAASAVTIAYVSSAAASVRVDVVRADDGTSVFSDERGADAARQETITWDGRGVAGLAADGRYEVRISTAAPGPRVTQRASVLAGGAAPQGAPAPSGAVAIGDFTFVGAVFPVRGPHTYGEDGAAYGAGRGGRSHAGQDVLAKCGTPIVAARGGTVKFKGWQGAAGHYVIVSDPVTGEDHGYMHLQAAATVARGDRVETGQQIGAVGMTGNASACLLHFEQWTAPGWYSGGTTVDPLPTLKAWDRLG